MRIFLFLFLFSICNGYAQTVTGVVQDIDENKIPLANVQLLNPDTGKIISFTQSDKNGAFTISANNVSFPLKIKLSHLSYESRELLLNEPGKVQIILEPKLNELEEIIIETKAYDVIKRGDTLSYNLVSLLDGSELKLKDVIDKLPGLAIDEDGKIRYNGVLIDHLLFDGNEFFDKNHQIANENITAEMIRKIELLTNYQNLSSMKDFENSGKTALNIGIKDDYKHRFKGNIDIEAGIKNRYNAHGNLYNFGEKTMFSLVANTNNINYSVLSVKDYLDIRNMNGKNMVREQLPKVGSSVSSQNLPSFLFAQDDVQSRRLTNYTLNLAHKFNENERLEFISTFNVLNQSEQTINQQTFFDNQSNNIQRTDEIEGKSAYTSNVLKYEKKFKNNAYFKINAYSLWSKDQQNQSIASVFLSDVPNLSFDNDVKVKTNNLGINAIYKNRLSKNLLLDAIVFYDYSNANTDKGFHSSEIFSWFGSNQFDLQQHTKAKNNHAGISGTATWKLGMNNLIFQAYSGWENEHLSNHITELSSFQLNDKYEKKEHSFSLQYQGTLKNSGLSYNLGLQYNDTNHFLYNHSKKSITAILPNASISYGLTKNSTVFGSYNSNLNGFSVHQFLTGNIIEDYRSCLKPSFLNPERMITDAYSVGMVYIVPEKNIFSTVSLSYSKARKKLEKSYINTELVSEQQFQYLDVNSTTSANITFNKKFREIPYGIKFNSFGTISQLQTILNNMPSDNTNYNLSANLTIQSYYNDSPFNFNAGINYMNNVSENEINAERNSAKLERITPFVSLTGLALDKKLNWNVDTNYYLYQSSSMRSQNIFDLGFRAQYNFSKNIQFYLNAQNMLNIRNDNTKNNLIITPYYTQEIIMRTLSGFVNAGAIFSF